MIKKKFKHDKTKWINYRNKLQSTILQLQVKDSPMAQALSYSLCYITYLQQINRKSQKDNLSSAFLNGFVSIKARHNQEMYFEARNPRKQINSIVKPLVPKIIQKIGQIGGEFNQFDQKSTTFTNKLLQLKTQKQVKQLLMRQHHFKIMKYISTQQGYLSKNQQITKGNLSVLNSLAQCQYLMQALSKSNCSLINLFTDIYQAIQNTNVRNAMESLRIRLIQLLECDKITMYVVDKKRKEVRSRPKADLDRIIILPINSGIVGQAAISGQVVNVQNAYKHKKFNSDMDKQSGYHTKTVLCVPIKDKHKEVIAVMQAINKISHPFQFTDQDILFLSLVGRLTKDILIASFRDEDTDAEQNLGIFISLMLNISKTRDLSQFINSSQQMVKSRFGFLQVKVYFYQEDKIITNDKAGKQIVKLPNHGSMVSYLRIIKKCYCLINSYSHPYFNNLVDIDTSLPVCNYPIWSEGQQISGCLQIVTAKGFTSFDQRQINVMLKSAIEDVIQYMSQIIHNLYIQKFKNL